MNTHGAGVEFGYLCSYFPVELVLAAGLHPARILPAVSPSTGLLPPFLCAPVRSYLEAGISGDLSALAGVGFVHACDAMQCLAQVWGVLVPAPRAFLVPSPTRRDQAALPRFRAALQRLGRVLGEFTGHQVGEEELGPALEEVNGHRSYLAALMARRDTVPIPDLWEVFRTPWRPPDRARPQDPAQRSARSQPPDPSQQTRPRLVLSGSPVPSPDLLFMLEEAGALVVGDDICTMERGLGLPTQCYNPEKDDPWDALARHYLGLPPCPCRHPGPEVRREHLHSLLESRRAQGAVLLAEKFCEPQLWEQHRTATWLRQKGIAVTVLEQESGRRPGERERTRLQAFVESLMATSPEVR